MKNAIGYSKIQWAALWGILLCVHLARTHIMDTPKRIIHHRASYALCHSMRHLHAGLLHDRWQRQQRRRAGGSDDAELPLSSKHVDAMNDEGAQEGLEEGVLAGSIDAAAAAALAEYKRSMAEGTAGGEAALMEQDEARRW